MKKHIAISIFVFLFTVVHAQNPSADYFVRVKKADSLYHVMQYKEAGAGYSAAFALLGGKGYTNDRYQAACAWSLAGYPDSAFLNLERIASKANFANLKHLSSDPDLEPLHSDNRWKPLLQLVADNKEKSEAGLNRPLLHLLDSLKEEDQKWRTYHNRLDNHQLNPGEDSIPKEQVIRKSFVADSLNYFTLVEVFAKYGYPGYDLVGQQGEKDFWLMMQHQDQHPDFQESVLQQMKIAVDSNKASAANFAYLTDRVKVNRGLLQVYGTQMQLNAEKSSYQPKPLIDPDGVNERRKSVGLEPIETYIEVMNRRYYGTLKKK